MFGRIGDTLGINASKDLVNAAQAHQVANWAKNLTNAIPYIGVALSLLSLASDVASEVEEAKNEAKLKEAKRDLLNYFDNVAESVTIEMRKSATAVMNDSYSQVEQMLSATKTTQELELGDSIETVRQVGLLRADCEDLIKLIV